MASCKMNTPDQMPDNSLACGIINTVCIACFGSAVSAITHFLVPCSLISLICFLEDSVCYTVSMGDVGLSEKPFFYIVIHQHKDELVSDQLLVNCGGQPFLSYSHKSIFIHSCQIHVSGFILFLLYGPESIADVLT